METVILEFDTEGEARTALGKAWEKMKITGEMHLRPQGSAWLLEITPEKDLTEATLEKLQGRRL